MNIHNTTQQYTTVYYTKLGKNMLRTSLPQNRCFWHKCITGGILAGTKYLKKDNWTFGGKFQEIKKAANASKSHSDQTHPARTPNNIQNSRERLQESSRKSTCRLSQEVGISRSVLRNLHDDLEFFPYKIQVLHSKKLLQ